MATTTIYPTGILATDKAALQTAVDAYDTVILKGVNTSFEPTEWNLGGLVEAFPAPTTRDEYGVGITTDTEVIGDPVVPPVINGGMIEIGGDSAGDGYNVYPTTGFSFATLPSTPPTVSIRGVTFRNGGPSILGTSYEELVIENCTFKELSTFKPQVFIPSTGAFFYWENFILGPAGSGKTTVSSTPGAGEVRFPVRNKIVFKKCEFDCRLAEGIVSAPTAHHVAVSTFAGDTDIEVSYCDFFEPAETAMSLVRLAKSEGTPDLGHTCRIFNNKIRMSDVSVTDRSDGVLVAGYSGNTAGIPIEIFRNDIEVRARDGAGIVISSREDIQIYENFISLGWDAYDVTDASTLPLAGIAVHTEYLETTILTENLSIRKNVIRGIAENGIVLADAEAIRTGNTSVGSDIAKIDSPQIHCNVH